MTFDELWPLVAPHTLLHRYKARMLHELVEATKFLGADVAECGVFRGGMTLMMAKQLEETGHKVHAFDSFEGLPAERVFRETCYYQPGALRGELLDFMRLLAFNNISNVSLSLGRFENTLEKVPESTNFSLIHVDCDVYTSTKLCIDRLYNNLLPGGIMVIDDYNDLGGGAQLAVTEHLEKTGELLYIGPIEQAFIVKGRFTCSSEESYIGWKPKKRDIAGPMTGKDLSVVTEDAEYLRDLESGKALPDIPGGSLQALERFARRMLVVWGHHRDVILKGVRER